jgi:hypothetical protein
MCRVRSLLSMHGYKLPVQRDNGAGHGDSGPVKIINSYAA